METVGADAGRYATTDHATLKRRAYGEKPPEGWLMEELGVILAW